ncbi:MAG: molybdopterin-dependent oxidoreductase [Candidatus Thermoplasmatota archaeon]|jgi:probable selenate reductase molybdenum-binding subunit|nr:molybdopterin-dependent oxidoreductase [Candidatus Thermoplasmatota archaeon]MDP7264990.1 molybdopterin-dependent oxidoreductase [Candidatus Thermoplasmatota archaeon]
MSGDKLKVVGFSEMKVDGRGLVTGKAKYTADWVENDMLHMKILGSPHAHARIKGIDTTRAWNLPGVVEIFTHENVPRIPHTTAGQGYPEPSPYDSFIVDRKVRFVGDRVAMVVAESETIAKEALGLIEVDYELLPAVLDLEEAMKEGAPVIHDEEEAHVIIPVPYDPSRNLVARVDMEIGDMEEGFSRADVIVEDSYYAHYAQHCPVEPHISLAIPDPDGRILIVTSTQVPFHVRRITAQALGIPVKRIRVIKPRIGGGFGTKQEILLEPAVALAALKIGRPVICELTRKEEFISSRTRHPIKTVLRTGCTREGEITAVDMHCLSNTGAYGSHGLTVVCNCGSKVLPLYKCDNVKFLGEAVYTNLPVPGAYRGYGATQAAFAMECNMNEMARKIGMDPLEFRKKNHIGIGDTSPIFEALGEGGEGVPQSVESCGLDQCIDRGAHEIGWKEKWGGNDGDKKIKRGIGEACLMQGSSIPKIDMGAASIKMNDDGSFNLLIGATDIGTGSDTILAQIAAEELGCRTEDMIVYSSDTDMTPFDVGAYASSTTYLTGTAVRKTAAEVKKQIIKVGAEMLGVSEEEVMVEDRAIISSETGESVSFKDVALRSLYMCDQHQIMATASHITEKSPPPFAAHFVEVEVDTETGEVKCLKYVTGTDCGQAINPQLAEGQTEGALLNGLSYALTEEYIFNDKGQMLNPNFKNYRIYRTTDLPEIVSFLVTTHEPTGPYGAKSVSEIGINGALPAISNAIYDAVGVRLTKPPFTAEKVLQALDNKNKF